MKSYIYLTSFPYSGSTLLSFLLDSHPKIASIGELSGPIPGMNMDTYQCSCGVRLVDCKFWLDIQKQMAKQNLPFEFHNFQTTYYIHTPVHFMDKIFLYYHNSTLLNYIKDAFFRLNWSQTKYINEVNDRCVAIAKIITQIRNADHFFDASKDSNKIKYFSNIKTINFKVISLIRDARSTICSLMKRNPGMATEDASRIWLKSMKHRDAIINNYIKPEQHLRITYEDICINQEATLANIYQFIGVKDHPINFPLKADNHHIIGNKMRVESIQSIYLDEKWKTELTDLQKAKIESIAGKQNSLYGYNC